MNASEASTEGPSKIAAGPADPCNDSGGGSWRRPGDDKVINSFDILIIRTNNKFEFKGKIHLGKRVSLNIKNSGFLLRTGVETIIQVRNELKTTRIVSQNDGKKAR